MTLSADYRERIRASWPRIIASIEGGSTCKGALAIVGISYTQLNVYLQTEPGARHQWDDAREASGHAFMDEALDLARSKVDKEFAQHARTQIDTLKWAARVRNPRSYADKATVDVNVRSVDLTKIISDANARLEAQRQGRIINGDSESNSGGALRSPAHAIPAAIEHALDLAPELASLL